MRTGSYMTGILIGAFALSGAIADEVTLEPRAKPSIYLHAPRAKPVQIADLPAPVNLSWLEIAEEPVAATVEEGGVLLTDLIESQPSPSVMSQRPASADLDWLQVADARADALTSVPVENGGAAPILLAELVEGNRRIPGQEPPEEEIIPDRPGQVPPPSPFVWPIDTIPVPDRWRIVESIGVNERWWDPYSQNTLKGDRPIFGEAPNEWFINLSAISDTVIEPRAFPLPVGNQTTDRAGEVGIFGRANQFVFNQALITSVSLIQGDTAYKPPNWEFRFTPVFNFNYAEVEERRILFVAPSKGTTRRDYFIGIQEAFVDYHIRNVSSRFDFDSVRIGIQPITVDFRRFLFTDDNLGIRFFGTRDSNRYQYNVAWFRRLEKDTNSGLNDVTQKLREDDIFIANLYRQDLPIPGLTSEISVIYNRNREGDDLEIDKNGFPVRPALFGNLRGRDYDVVYLGYNVDGRAGDVNLTASFYYALGEDRSSVFTGEDTDISAFFGAVEASMDFDWMRFRLSGLYASGDSDPYDNKEEGFDAIFENPFFAGADTNFWIRQPVPFIGGARAVGLTGRNGLLPSLRSSKEQGQSNFNNPGIILIGIGGDFDLTPEVRLSLNANHMWFDDTAVLEVLRNQGSISTDIGTDISAALIYRPGFIQNIVFRLSGAALIPGQGFDDIYADSSDRDAYYSVLFNAILTY